MRVIYEPKGAAKEYSDLAFNSYIKCPNACKYCFAPSIMHQPREEYHKGTNPRPEKILKDFEKDCATMQANGDTRRVHLNFISDPYPDCERELHITRRCIETAMRYGVKCNILTKGKYDTVRPDFDLFKKADVHFGITNCFANDDSRKEWEPNASTLPERFSLLKQAHSMGIYTWVSMEPVIYPEEALEFFDLFKHIVDLWKVGKLNYHPHAKTVDWLKFREDFKKSADYAGAKYILKQSLLSI